MEPAPPEPPASAVPALRLLIVDDHPLFRQGLGHFVQSTPGLTLCGEAANAPHALEAARRLQPDLVLLDISMPGTNGIELIKLLLAEHPKLPILVLSMHDESLYALRSLRAGAKGYVMKQGDMTQVAEAIRQVASGGIYVSPEFSKRLIFKAIQGSENDLGSPVDTLSDRELEVLELFGRGKSTREIAESLSRSMKTIETHRAHIKSKLGFKHADELVKFAVEWIAAKEG